MLTKPEAAKNNLTDSDLAKINLSDTAYIKAVMVKGQRLYSIHSAEGAPLGMVTERDVAFATARQNDLTPISVH